MKGKVADNMLYLKYNGAWYGPFEMSDDYQKYRIPWEVLITKRAELLLKGYEALEADGPPTKAFINFNTENPDIEVLKLAIYSLTKKR